MEDSDDFITVRSRDFRNMTWLSVNKRTHNGTDSTENNSEDALYWWLILLTRILEKHIIFTTFYVMLRNILTASKPDDTDWGDTNEYLSEIT